MLTHENVANGEEKKKDISSRFSSSCYSSLDLQSFFMRAQYLRTFGWKHGMEVNSNHIVKLCGIRGRYYKL